MQQMQKFFTIVTILTSLLQAQGADKYTDENRPYEFGFTIDGEQHRHEKKDENGIIMGEFGFITADGVYHVTVYATDENGNFKILSMKNIRMKPYPTSPATPSRQGNSLPFPPSQNPPQTQGPTSPQQPRPQASPAKACSHCSLPTTTTRAPPTALTDFAKVARDNPQYPNAGTNALYPGPPASTTIIHNNKPQDGRGGPNYQQNGNNGAGPNYQQGAGGSSGSNYPQGAGGSSGSNYPQGSPGSNYPQGASGGSGSNYPQGGSGGSGSNYPQTGTGGSGLKYVQGSGPSYNQPRGGSDYPSQNAGPNYSQQGLVSPYGQSVAGPSAQYPGQERNPKRIDDYPPVDNAGPGSHRSAPQKPTLISAQMQIVDKNTDVYHKNPGEQDGLPQGLTKNDMVQLLYTFNYTVGFHGHFEEGYTNGAKQGYYFVTGRNGVRTRIDYVADEKGFRPKTTSEVLDLLSDDVPKPETEKDEKYGLKGYEFKWLYYPVETKGKK